MAKSWLSILEPSSIAFRLRPYSKNKYEKIAIEIGFLKGDLEEIEKIFHCSSYSDKGAPTNSKFLAEVYYYMVNNEL